MKTKQRIMYFKALVIRTQYVRALIISLVCILVLLLISVRVLRLLSKFGFSIYVFEFFFYIIVFTLKVY